MALRQRPRHHPGRGKRRLRLAARARYRRRPGVTAAATGPAARPEAVRDVRTRPIGGQPTDRGCGGGQRSRPRLGRGRDASSGTRTAPDRAARGSSMFRPSGAPCCGPPAPGALPQVCPWLSALVPGCAPETAAVIRRRIQEGTGPDPGRPPVTTPGWSRRRSRPRRRRQRSRRAFAGGCVNAVYPAHSWPPVVAAVRSRCPAGHGRHHPVQRCSGPRIRFGPQVRVPFPGLMWTTNSAGAVSRSGPGRPRSTVPAPQRERRARPGPANRGSGHGPPGSGDRRAAVSRPVTPGRSTRVSP